MRADLEGKRRSTASLQNESGSWETLQDAIAGRWIYPQCLGKTDKKSAYLLRIQGFLVSTVVDVCLLGVDSAALHRNPLQPQTRGGSDSGSGGCGGGSSSSSSQKQQQQQQQLLPMLSSKVCDLVETPQLA
uniref:Uncharacterized protein n=1 Tax=Rousettus aegyptiacus TaxID=9407 RepID=A0A7J8GAL8_ROUAE|nr:hypothetical protein HJG63_011521 [Rousettus aegyptiacus]